MATRTVSRLNAPFDVRVLLVSCSLKLPPSSRSALTNSCRSHDMALAPAHTVRHTRVDTTSRHIAGVPRATPRGDPAGYAGHSGYGPSATLCVPMRDARCGAPPPCEEPVARTPPPPPACDGAPERPPPDCVLTHERRRAAGEERVNAPPPRRSRATRVPTVIVAQSRSRQTIHLTVKKAIYARDRLSMLCANRLSLGVTSTR
jgi:hypothetical protein